MIGRETLSEILARYGITEAAFTQEDAWVSLEFVEAFVDDLVAATGDSQLDERVARAAMSRKYLGPVYTFFRNFGTPLFAYTQFAKATGRVNKTGDWKFEVRGRNACSFTFALAPGIGRERTTHVCRGRRVTLAQVPTMFDMAPAIVEEPQCMLRGDPCCRY